MSPTSMLETVWKNVGESSGRRWRLAAMVPALVFWGACGLVYHGVLHDVVQTGQWWDGLTDTQRSFLLFSSAIVITLTAFGINVLGASLLRLAEGYWENIPLIGRPLQRRLRQNVVKSHTRWKELSQKLMVRDHP